MRTFRAIALIVVVAVAASLVGVPIAPRAHATPAYVTALTETLDVGPNSLQSWTGGLGSIGKLAEALPAAQASPGAVLGFPDLLHQWLNDGSEHLAAATIDGGLNVDQDIDLGDGRTGHLTSVLTTLGNGDRQLVVTWRSRPSTTRD